MHSPANSSCLQTDALVHQLAEARERTLALIALVEDDALNRSLNPGFSPLRWHLGHVAAFEAAWVLVRAGGRDSPDPEFDRLFDPTRNPKAERVHLPPREALLDYARRVRVAALDVLAGADPDHPNPLLRDGYIGWMVHEHERQHQETMTILLHMLPFAAKRRPDGWQPQEPGAEPADELVSVPAGPFLMGANGRRFAYDNEREPHTVHLDACRIARAPVTELAYVQFLESGGYRDPGPWSPAGWRWRVENDITSPRDWTATEAGGWTIRTLFAERPPLAGHPVIGVSYHEAEAFARWAGRRLPTEAQWERAAAWDERLGHARRFPWGDEEPTPERANCAVRAWGTRPITAAGRSPIGCDDMAGQVWEWTASAFAPYPGFRPFPYEGYSQAWFDGRHQVLRGGSWATAGPLCRASFRNWYHPHVREIHAGFRTAAPAG